MIRGAYSSWKMVRYKYDPIHRELPSPKPVEPAKIVSLNGLVLTQKCHSVIDYIP